MHIMTTIKHLKITSHFLYVYWNVFISRISIKIQTFKWDDVNVYVMWVGFRYGRWNKNQIEFSFSYNAHEQPWQNAAHASSCQYSIFLVSSYSHIISQILSISSCIMHYSKFPEYLFNCLIIKDKIEIVSALHLNFSAFWKHCIPNFN